MKNEWFVIFIVIISVIGLFVFLSQKDKASENYDEFAKCISSKGAAMYGAYWCGHCQNQKEMFGTSFQYVNYIECTENQNFCNEKNIGGYPTWIINNVQYPGEQSFQRLSELTGCDLNV